MNPRRLLNLFAATVCLAGVSMFAKETPASPLPEYQPAQQVTGVIRICGNPHMAKLLELWEEGFRKQQPGIFFTTNLKSTATGVFGLAEGVADVAAMGRRVYTYEYYGIYRRSLMLPIEIAVASGSFDVPHKSYALTVFVHRDNPLAQLTVSQLDGIFGAQRTGGWQGLQWSKAPARGAEKNLRTWGQLGLTGEWANRPIHVYGPPGIFPGGQSFFQARVMGGADTWAENLREYEDRGQMLRDLANDPLGIAYTGMNYRTDGTKPLAIAANDSGPYVATTRATVADRTYPLSRFVYLVLPPDQPTGDAANPPVDPKVREFLRYVLSREGQEAVAREGDYLPLTSQIVEAELQRVDAPTSGSVP